MENMSILTLFFFFGKKGIFLKTVLIMVFENELGNKYF